MLKIYIIDTITLLYTAYTSLTHRWPHRAQQVSKKSLKARPPKKTVINIHIYITMILRSWKIEKLRSTVTIPNTDVLCINNHEHTDNSGKPKDEQNESRPQFNTTKYETKVMVPFNQRVEVHQNIRASFCQQWRIFTFLDPWLFCCFIDDCWSLYHTMSNLLMVRLRTCMNLVWAV